jgi:DNA-binding protein YbaB
MDNNEKKTRKQQLIEDIEKLLNSYEGVSSTTINPTLLEFMDEETLVQMIDSLLAQKEALHSIDDEEKEWLNKFKKEN